MLKQFVVFAVQVIAISIAGTAHAWEFRTRFVERIGNQNVVLDGNAIDASNLQSRRIRIQFGVFDTGGDSAPAGGLIGWNEGTITVGGGADNSDEYRNSAGGIPNQDGRLNPFLTGGPIGFGAGLPADDPFDSLRLIDNRIGNQVIPWGCGEELPSAVSRGLNTYVSTHEITIAPRASATSYLVTYAGSLSAALGWDLRELPGDPCDPDFSGFLTYVPVAAPARQFSASLLVVVPSPSAALVLAAFAWSPRRRR